MTIREELPLSDERSTALHTADECKFEQCSYCGCCAHGQPLNIGCKVEGAPSGMNCPNWTCCCEGQS